MSLAAGLARGLESGFNMGLRAEEVRDRKKREDQAVERAARYDQRAEQELGLRRSIEERQAKRDERITRRQGAADAIAALTAERDDIVKQAGAMQTAGSAVGRDAAARYGAVRQQLAQAREVMTRLAAQDLNLDDVPDKDFYTSAALTLGTRPENLPVMARGAKEVEMGFDQQDQAMMLKGANSLLLPYLERGIGDESPYGGKITRKQVVAFVPARGGDGQDRSDMVYPVLRVFVDTPNGEKYYDAPMTKGGSTVAEDNPVAIDLNRAFNWMGNVGVLGQAFQEPGVAAKLAKGREEAGDVDAALAELRALSRPTKKQITYSDVDAGDRKLRIGVDETGREVSREEIKVGAKPRAAVAGGGGRGGGAATRTLEAKLALLKQDLEDGLITEDEYRDDRRRIISGHREPRASDQGIQDRVNEAVNAVGADLGVRYDGIARDWRTADGNPVTPAQRTALQRAAERASTMARDMAARGKQVTQTDLVQAARGAAAPAPAAGGGANLPSVADIDAELKRRGAN